MFYLTCLSKKLVHIVFDIKIYKMSGDNAENTLLWVSLARSHQ